MVYEMAYITAFHQKDPLKPAGEHMPHPPATADANLSSHSE